MNPISEPKDGTRQTCLKRAFTLIELLVVIGILCLLASFMLPALARAKFKSPSAGCLSNLRQMQLGAAMYRDDNNDVLLPNAPAGVSSFSAWCPTSVESWNAAIANTNRRLCTNTLLWPYVAQDINVYRCPGDVKPSANGFRIRSYSMNGQMGVPLGSTIRNYNPSSLIYYRGADLTCPTPASAFIFCDESMYSLNDGYLELDLSAPDFPDVPAAYLGGGCGFSFADGHAEVQKWVGPFLVGVTGLCGVPYQYGVANNTVHWPPTTGPGLYMVIPTRRLQGFQSHSIR